MKLFRGMPVPLPPLPEQQRIVSKVDELMGLCDRLAAAQERRRGVRVRLNRASLDRVTSVSQKSELSAAWQRVCDHFEVLYDTPETIGDLRQTVLQLAVQGKLAKQDPKDEPADIALERMRELRRELIDRGQIRQPKALTQISDCEPPFETPTGWRWER